jgi:AcrR family transcriptional regulator
VHRHFPTKDALLAGVVVDRLEEITELAIGLSAAADPEAAFFEVVRRLTTEARANLVLTTALDGEAGPEISAAGARLTAALSTLLDRAQRAGAVKPDLTAESLHAVLGGAIAMERRLPTAQSGLGLQIVLDGLRAQT